MRRAFDDQCYFKEAGKATLQVAQEFREQYERISQILEANAEIVRIAHEDLAELTPGGKDRRGCRYTSENIVRALIVHTIEQTPWRETAVRISEMPFLRDFVRLGPRPVMDFTFLNACFKVLRPATWARINEVLCSYGMAQGQVDASKIRVDTTVVEANIHFPTDASLVWDVWRVSTRLLRRVREHWAGLVPHRFHNRKVKKDYLYVLRYSRSEAKKRQCEVRRRQRRLLSRVEGVVTIAESVCRTRISKAAGELTGLVGELTAYLPAMRQVVSVAGRVWLKRETVAARERVFSIFEPHVELIKRGKFQKPVEFGHAMWMSQTPDKFILDFDVMEHKVPDE